MDWNGKRRTVKETSDTMAQPFTLSKAKIRRRIFAAQRKSECDRIIPPLARFLCPSCATHSSLAYVTHDQKSKTTCPLSWRLINSPRFLPQFFLELFFGLFFPCPLILFVYSAPVSFDFHTPAKDLMTSSCSFFFSSTVIFLVIFCLPK